MKPKIIFAILYSITMIYAYCRYSIRESEDSLFFAIKYFFLPCLVIVTPLCYIYRSVILPIEQDMSSGFKRKIKIIQGVLACSLGFCFILTATLQAGRLITNEYFGYKMVYLNAAVIRSYKTTHHGNKSYYVILEDKSGKKIKLSVEKLYKYGTPFNWALKLGYWGILFRTKSI